MRVTTSTSAKEASRLRWGEGARGEEGLGRSWGRAGGGLAGTLETGAPAHAPPLRRRGPSLPLLPAALLFAPSPSGGRHHPQRHLAAHQRA
jgi:hypothetical protein